MSVFFKGISMTDASGKPYVKTSTYNGSLASMTTMTTTTSNGSSVTRSPLRSSLKKPRPTGDSSLGIHNPGFSQGSPTMQRNGSVKKVRIQTHSTAVWEKNRPGRGGTKEKGERGAEGKGGGQVKPIPPIRSRSSNKEERNFVFWPNREEDPISFWKIWFSDF